MSKPASLLIQLQGNARLLDISKIKGIGNDETHVWKLDDGSSIVIHAKARMQNGKRAAKIECAEKSQQPFKVVVANIKRRYTLLRKKVEVQRCI